LIGADKVSILPLILILGRMKMFCEEFPIITKENIKYKWIFMQNKELEICYGGSL